MSRKSMLYVLELEPEEDPNARWYVGISEDPDKRYREHKTGHGAAWTRRNKIISKYIIGKERHVIARKLETQLTKALMSEYGVESTRGGNFLKPNLNRRPDLDEVFLPPGLAIAMGGLENEELAKLSERSGVFLTIKDRLTFSDMSEAYDWIDESLPEGIDVRIDRPASAGWQKFTTGTNDEEE